MLYFDIGANHGYWALKNLENNKDILKIISVEPVPNTFSILKNNCINENKIDCLNYAVCDNNNEDIKFYDALNAHTLSTLNINWLTDSNNRFYNTNYKEIICHTITIDNLIKKYGVPDLIKIDVEGGEYECIKSLTKKYNLLCFEWASETNEITYKCIDYLFNLGYSNFSIQYRDDYLYRPKDEDFYDLTLIKDILSDTVPKHDWGMIWCK